MFSESDKLELLCTESMIDIIPFNFNTSTASVFPNEVIIPLTFYDSTSQSSTEMEDVKEPSRVKSMSLTLVYKLNDEYKLTNKWYRCEALKDFLYVGKLISRAIANSLPNNAITLLPSVRLPPKTTDSPNITLALDLDETLISSSSVASSTHAHSITIKSNGISYNV